MLLRKSYKMLDVKISFANFYEKCFKGHFASRRYLIGFSITLIYVCYLLAYTKHVGMSEIYFCQSNAFCAFRLKVSKSIGLNHLA